MKILSAEQVAKADAYTIEHEPIKSIDLMERAAKACFGWITSRYDKTRAFKVFAGVGNNGGDGLVIARLLREKGYDVHVFIVSFSDKVSSDFNTNLQRFKKLDSNALTTLTEDKAEFEHDWEDAILIDAIFGSGLNRQVKGFAAKVILEINDCQAEVISIDIPSGLFTQDNRTNNTDSIIRAHTTLSLELPKLAFLFAENQDFVGQWYIVPIGLDSKFVNAQDSRNYYTGRADVVRLMKPRSYFGHKGTFGHALLCGGSKGMIGAAVLMSKGCLRSGVGLVTTVVPQCGYSILQEAVPEVLCKNLEEIDILSGSLDSGGYEAVGIGPGIGTHKRTELWLQQMLTSSKVPLVLDADALNIISGNREMLELLPKGAILTPHPGEFERLAGKFDSGFERVEQQIEFSVKYGVYIVLKGRHTSIASPDGNVYFNSSGNSGMATGGSGDVLTGLITGLLAQGYNALEACIIGVYIHGVAGDLQADKISEEALISGDIVNGIGEAFLETTVLK